MFHSVCHGGQGHVSDEACIATWLQYLCIISLCKYKIACVITQHSFWYHMGSHSYIIFPRIFIPLNSVEFLLRRKIVTIYHLGIWFLKTCNFPFYSGLFPMVRLFSASNFSESWSKFILCRRYVTDLDCLVIRVVEGFCLISQSAKHKKYVCDHVQSRVKVA